MIRSKAILRAAKGQECTMRSPKCNHDPETTVAAHSNWHFHNKGMGHKADDIFHVQSCSACHAWLDTSGASKEDRMWYWTMGHARTLQNLIRRGFVKIEGYKP